MRGMGGVPPHPPGSADGPGPDRGRRAASRVPGRGLDDRAPRRPTLPRLRWPGQRNWRAVRAGTAVPGARCRDEAQDGGDDALLAAARRAAAEHQEQHGQPVTRDALRARLGVSNQAASELLRQLRTGEGLPPGTSRAAVPTGLEAGAGQPPRLPAARADPRQARRARPLPDDITVHLDAGPDSGKTRDELRSRSLNGEIAHKGDRAPVQAGQCWHVERTNAWHNNFNRLQRCYERTEEVIDAFFDLADAIITLRRLIREAWTLTAGTPDPTGDPEQPPTRAAAKNRQQITSRLGHGGHSRQGVGDPIRSDQVLRTSQRP